MTYRKHLVLTILVFNLLTVGSANAISDEVEQHIGYTRALNTIVSKVMTWYGSLLEPTKNISFHPIDEAWSIYRNQYPKDINQIKILKTDLQQSKDNDKRYTLNVETAMFHKAGNQLANKKYINEQFEFQIAENDHAVITEISFKEQDIEQIERPAHLSHTFDGLDFKSREFVYGWLAYLDDVDIQQTNMMLEEANYAIQIGSININKPFHDAFKERKQFLARGGHTLRAIEIIKKEDNPNQIQLVITMNWKGVNVKNKSVIAKVEQKIELQIESNNSWKIISIEEQHLLPDLTPWQDLLC